MPKLLVPNLYTRHSGSKSLIPLGSVQKVIQCLADHPQGIAVSEIAHLTEVNRYNVNTILECEPLARNYLDQGHVLLMTNPAKSKSKRNSEAPRSLSGKVPQWFAALSPETQALIRERSSKLAPIPVFDLPEGITSPHFQASFASVAVVVQEKLRRSMLSPRHFKADLNEIFTRVEDMAIDGQQFQATAAEVTAQLQEAYLSGEKTRALLLRMQKERETSAA